MCVLLPQSTCKKTQKAKATDGSSHRRRRLYGKILQIYNRAAATDTHTHDPATNSTGNSTYSLASEATASHRPDARSDARPSPKTSPQQQQQQRQQAPSREFQLCNWKEEGGNALAKEEMVPKFLFGELDIVLCYESKKTVRLCSGNGEERKREGRRGGLGLLYTFGGRVGWLSVAVVIWVSQRVDSVVREVEWLAFLGS